MDLGELCPANFIDYLSAVLFTPENIERANQYARSRGLDPSKFIFPWACVDEQLAPFQFFRKMYPPVIFTQCLYIPIVEVDQFSPPVLAGFDIRYLGAESHRLRWHKFRRHPDSPLVYNIAATLKADNFIITEAAMDAEAFRLCAFEGVEVLSPLTSMATPRFVQFLLALGTNVYMAYDNDDDGRRSTSKIMEIASQHPEAAKCIKPLLYPGKDANAALTTIGLDALRHKVKMQLF